MKFNFLLILCIVIFSCKSDNKKTSLTETTNRIGIRKFKVADENIKDSIVEYININGKEYANQIWIVDKKNDTIGGNYFDTFIMDTTELGKVTKLQFTLTKPTIKWESDMFVILPDEEKLKEDFSNLSEIKLDTFHSLKNDGISNDKLLNLDLPLNHIAEFGIEYSTSGKKRIRGLIVERGKVKGKGFERRLFFDKTVYVKE
ncbi:hypothetical protein SAMN05444411_1254 [Lutibacter oricola]|uniref:Uncharacterized protein n=1 Tax=Lutibacter oricola TaxID=762486 RepID=A0A1H3H5G2_9FLAO|nr:hypothetical protein [Lutibacter oricola]SDY10138.1 hypothetical protein SAMN05444411_1254 [Lutibacter oricola]